MTNSNLKTFDNFYADLAQSAYNGRPNNFPPDNNALDYQLFDFSRDNKFYNIDKKEWEITPGGKKLLMAVKYTCSRILIYTMFIKSQQFLFLIRTV